MFARHRDARGMNNVILNTARPKPARQPEAIASGLISDNDALDALGERFEMSNNTKFYIGGEWVDPLPLPRVSIEAGVLSSMILEFPMCTPGTPERSAFNLSMSSMIRA
jgi:hypothetical protein